MGTKKILQESEERLSQINDCFLNFSPDSLDNINRLTSLCGMLFGATCALYNRLDQGLLCSWGQWNTPSNYDPVDQPDGHICYDIIKKGTDEVIVVPNLQSSHYARTDPNVIPYKLQTYVGRAVKFCDSFVGSLCVVFQDDYVPSELDKKVMGIIASAIGVEEARKRAEDALRESEERFRTIFENAQDAIFIKDEVFRYKNVNPAMERLFELPVSDLVGKTDEALFGKEVGAYIREIDSRVFNGEIIEHEHTKPVHGIPTTFHVIKVPMHDASGKIVGLCGIARDITKRKQAEDALQKAHAELEMKVKKRTAELVKMNEQLKSKIEERRHAESALKERGKELESKTHELEEVNTALKVLLKHRDNDKKEFEEKIVANVKKLVLPYIEKLNASRLNDRQTRYLDMIKSNLEDIIAPFINHLSSKYSDLTPTEIQVAGLVKDGKTTKEISDLLNLSTGAVNFHRNNLRKKMGLRNTKKNLKSFLLTLS